MKLPLFGLTGLPLLSGRKEPVIGSEECDSCSCPGEVNCGTGSVVTAECVCFDPLGASPFVGYLQPDYYYVSKGNLSPEGGCFLGRWDESFSILWGPGLGEYHEAIAQDAFSAFTIDSNFDRDEDGNFTCDYAYDFFAGWTACGYDFYGILSTRPWLYVQCGCFEEDGGIGLGLAWVGDTGGFSSGYQKPDPYNPLSSGGLDCPVSLPFGPVSCPPVYTSNPGADREYICGPIEIGEATFGFVAKVPFLENVTIERLSGDCVEENSCVDGPSAGFTAHLTHNCTFEIVNTSRCGACGEEDTCRYFWSDGYEGRDRPPYRITAGGDCGTLNRTLMLVVIDDRNCVSTFQLELSCCRCEDGSGNPCRCTCTEGGSGSLGVSQTGPCTFEICGTIDPSCPTGSIEYRILGDGENCTTFGTTECPCDDDEWEGPAFSDCLGCFHSIGNSCTEHTFDQSVQIVWRFRESACGCAGPWSEPIDLDCLFCDCCSTPISGCLVTIGGTTQGDLEGCLDCDDKINGSYFVPFTSLEPGSFTCSGSFDFEDQYECEHCEVPPCGETITISVTIVCYPGAGPEGQDVVEVYGQITAPSLGAVDFLETHLFPPDTIPLDCVEELSGALTNLYLGADPWLNYCSGSSMSFFAQFIS